MFYTVVPGKPDVSVEQIEATVSVSWILKLKNGIIKNYHVTYTRDDDTSDRRNLTTRETNQTFDDLKAGKTYEFQVGYVLCNLHVKPKQTVTGEDCKSKRNCYSIKSITKFGVF